MYRSEVFGVRVDIGHRGGEFGGVGGADRLDFVLGVTVLVVSEMNLDGRCLRMHVELDGWIKGVAKRV